MKGDRVEAVVDTGQGGTQTPAHEESSERPVEVSTRRRMGSRSSD
jgi:hypothetical protein